MTDQLDDELLSINSIYDESTLRKASASDYLFILTLPALPDISVRVEFPQNYPDCPPAVLGTQSTGHDAVKGEGQRLVVILRTVLAEVFMPGSPCVYDLIEETTVRLQQLGFLTAENDDGSTQATSIQHDLLTSTADLDSERQHLPDLGQAAQWILSDVVTEKKSVFAARAVQIESVEQAKQYLQILLATDKRVARATHNITAWRVRAPNNVQYQDCDDDGETAAGSRLLHLLELMDAWNIMVVVTRWYGGVHLGPDRFRIINQVARDAVIKGGWSTDHGHKKKPKR